MSDYETDKYIKHLESQIEKLQGEIERLKEFESGYIRQAELLTASIAREDELEAKLAQQPTVEVDALLEKYYTKWLSSGGIQVKEVIKQALTEALQGSYTREDMRKYAIGFLDSIRDYERENGQRICFDERESSELLDQYDTERGNSNG